jgi:hypothetical protein
MRPAFAVATILAALVLAGGAQAAPGWRRG